MLLYISGVNEWGKDEKFFFKSFGLFLKGVPWL